MTSPLLRLAPLLDYHYYWNVLTPAMALNYVSARHHGLTQNQLSTPRIGRVVILVTMPRFVVFNPYVMQSIDPFIANPDFEAKQIEKASKACTAICLWVRAMHKYNTVAKQVEPKRKLLAEKQVHGYTNPL